MTDHPLLGQCGSDAAGSVLYEFARFVAESWDDEYPGKPFTVDPECSRLAIAADLADLIASRRYDDAYVIAGETQGAERLAAALHLRHEDEL